MFIAASAAIGTLFINVARSFIDPCAPPLLGSYFLDCPLCDGPRPDINLSTWIPLLALDFYFTINIGHKGFFYPIHIVCATTGRLVDYVDIMTK